MFQNICCSSISNDDIESDIESEKRVKPPQQYLKYVDSNEKRDGMPEDAVAIISGLENFGPHGSGFGKDYHAKLSVDEQRDNLAPRIKKWWSGHFEWRKVQLIL
jgi:hypothetical protein